MNDSSTMTPPNPSGLCMCGCGQKTRIARQTRRDRGDVMGLPVRYVIGHSKRRKGPEYIIDENDCWVWLGYASSNGYGHKRVNGKEMPAHRAYYEHMNGSVPDGLQLDHLCRNRMCVNPAHLEAVTPAENVRRGKSTPFANVDILRVRARLISQESCAAIARDYGVSGSCISGIKQGKTWADVR